MPATRTQGLHAYLPASGGARLEADLEQLVELATGEKVSRREDRRSVCVALADVAARAIPGGPVTVETYADLEKLFAALGLDLAGVRESQVEEERRSSDATLKAHRDRVAAARRERELAKKGESKQ